MTEEERKAIQQDIHDLAVRLVTRAEFYGVIVTIERIPTPGKPLAMREHVAQIETRMKR